MRAYVLSIGSELILGHLTDTNATFLAQELAALGVDLLHVVHVGDDRPRLARAVRMAVDDADLVICSGGVGPTEDDLTREAIADVAGEEPTVDPEILSGIQRFFTARGLTMPVRNQKQAWRIPSAEILPNPVGTAPGWFVRIDDAFVAAMPGVPREMTRMWREQVVPRITPLLSGRVLRSTTFKTIGIGESAAEQILADLVALPNPVVATYAKDDGVHVRVTGIGIDEPEAERLRRSAADEVVQRLARHIYADDETPLAAAVLRLLAERDLTVAVADEGGGGRFASLLASTSEAGKTLVQATLRPGPGGDASALAATAATTTGASIGLGISVVCEPTDLGLYTGAIEIAIAGTANAAETFPMRAAFEEIQRRSALNAADLLRRALLDFV